MNSDGHERITDTEQLANGTPANHDDAHLAEPPITEAQNGLHQEVERLRREVDHLREQQQALTRTPQSNDLGVSDDEAQDDQSDDAHRRMLSLLLVSRLIEDPEYLRVQLRKLRGHMSIDYVGIGFLALSLGALQVVLDKGQEDNWFYSPMIATLEVIFPIALVLFIVWELTRSKPVMDLRMFKNRNFAASAVSS